MVPSESKHLLERRHGEMEYMERHGTKRARPAELVPGTVRIISARMDYWPDGADPEEVLGDPTLGYVSRYAVGRDYHKVLRAKLQALADRWTVVGLLQQGKPYREISKQTGVSVTTIGRVARYLEDGNGGYARAARRLGEA